MDLIIFVNTTPGPFFTHFQFLVACCLLEIVVCAIAFMLIHFMFGVCVYRINHMQERYDRDILKVTEQSTQFKEQALLLQDKVHTLE